MNKIPTVFKRDPEDMRRLLSEVHEDCQWVLDGEGVATRKYDGTCCMFDGKRWWARREVKDGGRWPQEFQQISRDPNTQKTVGWVPMESSSFAKWQAEAVELYPGGAAVPGTYELCGPKVNGNPEGYDCHVIVRHSGAERLPLVGPFNLEYLRTVVMDMANDAGWEGIVWHHPDGRMAKLKGRDFA
jgi:hypothetical protein